MDLGDGGTVSGIHEEHPGAHDVSPRRARLA
jgi:hypothetical protein